MSIAYLADYHPLADSTGRVALWRAVIYRALCGACFQFFDEYMMPPHPRPPPRDGTAFARSHVNGAPARVLSALAPNAILEQDNFASRGKSCCKILASCPGASLELLVPVGLAQVLTEPALLPRAVTKCHAGRELCASLETSSQASQVFIRSP
jgi:hypothetical protein